MSDAIPPSRITTFLETTAKVLTPIVVFVVGSYYTCTQDRIEHEQKALDRCISLSKDMTSNSEVQKELSIALILDQCGKYEALKKMAATRLVLTAAQSNSAEVVESAKKAAITLSADTSVAAEVAQAVKNLPPRIYIHVPDETRRGEASDISKKLQLNIVSGQPSYVVEGIENVGAARSPSSTQVRYFRAEDAGLAKNISDQLSALGITDAKPALSAGKAIPFQLEIWFGKPQIRQVDPRTIPPVTQVDPRTLVAPTP
jgi:hypothetical protein